MVNLPSLVRVIKYITPNLDGKIGNFNYALPHFQRSLSIPQSARVLKQVDLTCKVWFIDNDMIYRKLYVGHTSKSKGFIKFFFTFLLV